MSNPAPVMEPSTPPDKRRLLQQAFYSSLPSKQFGAQLKQAMARRVRIASASRKLGAEELGRIKAQCQEGIKNSWTRQGIWRSCWRYDKPGRFRRDEWKHEGPLDPREKGAGRDWEGKRIPYLPDIFAPEIAKREHNASRPIVQFLFQVQSETFRLLAEHEANVAFYEESQSDPALINMGNAAYSTVKEQWREWRIWDERWGAMPGMSWLHEQSVFDLSDEEMAALLKRGPLGPQRPPPGKATDRPSHGLCSPSSPDTQVASPASVTQDKGWGTVYIPSPLETVNSPPPKRVTFAAAESDSQGANKEESVRQNSSSVPPSGTQTLSIPETRRGRSENPSPPSLRGRNADTVLTATGSDGRSVLSPGPRGVKRAVETEADGTEDKGPASTKRYRTRSSHSRRTDGIRRTSVSALIHGGPIEFTKSFIFET